MDAAPLPPPRSAAFDAAFVVLDGLVKQFDSMMAVDDVSLALGRGEIFALLGPSGCGKSTLLRMLAGFETPTRGRVLLAGEDITEIPAYRRPINMMFQSYALFPHLSVFDNIAFGLRRAGQPKARVQARVDEMLALVQLGPYAQRKPHQLSGGQQQRVALARSLALEPQLLLLDEPLGALDRKLRAQTQFELKAILKRVGVTCLLVTHDQEEAMMMADRIAVLNRGKVLQVGTGREIYETPNSRFVADFVGSVNVLDGVLIEDEPDHCVVETAVGRLTVGHGVTGTLGMALALAVRPEKILVTTASPPEHATNWITGTVRDGTYFGSATTYRVRLPGGIDWQVSQINQERHAEGLDPGATVHVHVAPDALVVLTA